MFVRGLYIPLKANQVWFTVRDDELYRGRGLKGLGIDVKQAWAKVIQKSKISMEGVKALYRRVAETIEDLIGALGTAENKVVKVALADRPRVNRCFDLLGLTYPDRPMVDLKDAEGGRKRKRSVMRDKGIDTSKQC